jgi:PPM family protein phosphatase
VLGVDFYELDRSTDLAVSDLTPTARTRVRGSITADDSGDADRILAALRDQRLPTCRTAGRGSGATEPSPAPSTAAPTTAQVPAPGEPALTEPPAPEASASSSPARTTASSEPGVNCRETS